MFMQRIKFKIINEEYFFMSKINGTNLDGFIIKIRLPVISIYKIIRRHISEDCYLNN